MAKAVVATAYGGPEVLTVGDFSVGSPGPGELLIDVRAAGPNPVDYKMYLNAVSPDPALLPMRVGREAAEVVVSVGEGAEGPMGTISAGDEVIAYPVTGAYAEQLWCPGRACCPSLRRFRSRRPVGCSSPVCQRSMPSPPPVWSQARRSSFTARLAGSA